MESSLSVVVFRRLRSRKLVAQAAEGKDVVSERSVVKRGERLTRRRAKITSPTVTAEKGKARSVPYNNNVPSGFLSWREGGKK